MTTLTQRARHHALSQAQTRSLRERNGVPEGYFTTGGAATYLECKMDAIWTAVKTGKLTGEKFGRLTCFTKEELDAFDACRRGTPVLDTAVDTPPCRQSQSLKGRKRRKITGKRVPCLRPLHSNRVRPLYRYPAQQYKRAPRGVMCRRWHWSARRRTSRSLAAA